MVVMDYELNLSTTEFFYFLECPQKFRIYRILNPLPNKSDFMNYKRTKTSYQKRGYIGNKMKGINYHHFFETFHKLNTSKITNKRPPKDVQKNKVKLLYWIIQQEKYFEAKEDYYWHPYATELQLMTDKQRGIIDCIELCEDKNGLRLIDYKPNPDPNDYLTLLFYANLFNEYRLENKDDERLDYNIMEIGCYYYELGYYQIYELNNTDLDEFIITLEDVRNKIRNIELCLNKNFCLRCEFKIICEIEQKRL